MQVSIDFAEQHAQGYPSHDGSIRQEVFTRRGGMYFGIAHLLGYPASYERPLYRFADFNAGWYASRNAAFQAALSKVTVCAWRWTATLIAPGRSCRARPKRRRAKWAEAGAAQPQIRRQLEDGDSLAFEDSKLYAGVFALADAAAGPLPRAVLPGIELKSPKITRKLTTAWFAGRVDERYQRCMKR